MSWDLGNPLIVWWALVDVVTRQKSKYSQQQVLFSMPFYRDSSSYKEQIRIATNTVSLYMEQVDFSPGI